MATSQNGWPALEQDSRKLYTWAIPTKAGVVAIRMRNGSAGFLLALWVMWYANHIEPVVGKVLDDWGWNWRPIRGEVTGLSNHASGTAVDVNATKHPLGRVGTLSFLIVVHAAHGVRKMTALARIKTRLAVHFRGTIRAGACYHGRKDEMHYEINVPLAKAEKVARKLMKTPAGKRLLAANPTQHAVILS
jgi:hypothetical protein